MTLEELEQSLPNGLHDAQIDKMTMDYLHSELTLAVRVWVGLLSQPRPEKDRYRSSKIVFDKVHFFSIELPQAGSSFKFSGSVWFSYERMAPAVVPKELAGSIPSGTQCYSLFVQDWLSHIHVCAADVSFSWIDPV